MLDDPVGDAGCHSHAGNSSSVLQAQSGPMAAEVAAGTDYHQVTVLACRPYLTGIVHLLCLAKGWCLKVHNWPAEHRLSQGTAGCRVAQQVVPVAC
jgi:hypothetical protein